MNWQPIETAPKDGSVVLVAHSSAVFDAWWDREECAWVDGVAYIPYEELRHYEPTHWMHLPEPPQEQEDE